MNSSPVRSASRRRIGLLLLIALAACLLAACSSSVPANPVTASHGSAITFVKSFAADFMKQDDVGTYTTLTGQFRSTVPDDEWQLYVTKLPGWEAGSKPKLANAAQLKSLRLDAQSQGQATFTGLIDGQGVKHTWTIDIISESYNTWQVNNFTDDVVGATTSSTNGYHSPVTTAPTASPDVTSPAPTVAASPSAATSTPSSAPFSFQGTTTYTDDLNYTFHVTYSFQSGPTRVSTAYNTPGNSTFVQPANGTITAQSTNTQNAAAPPAGLTIGGIWKSNTQICQHFGDLSSFTMSSPTTGNYCYVQLLELGSPTNPAQDGSVYSPGVGHETGSPYPADNNNYFSDLPGAAGPMLQAELNAGPDYYVLVANSQKPARCPLVAGGLGTPDGTMQVVVTSSSATPQRCAIGTTG